MEFVPHVIDGQETDSAGAALTAHPGVDRITFTRGIGHR